MPKEPTVYLVDDDPGALESLGWLVSQAGLPVRAFDSGQAFLEHYRPQDLGCLVLDVRMPPLGGMEVQERLADAGVRLPIIFVTAHGDVAACSRALKAGAVDFLEKPVDGEVFLAQIRKALAVAEERAAIAERLSQLTPREKEVLELLVLGKTTKEIATLMNIRSDTVWKHRLAVFSKTGVENEVELVRFLNELRHK